MTSPYSPDVVAKWLESAEGERWSREYHSDIRGALICIKEDLDITGKDGMSHIALERVPGATCF